MSLFPNSNSLTRSTLASRPLVYYGTMLQPLGSALPMVAQTVTLEAALLGHLMVTVEYFDGVTTVTRRVSNDTFDGGTYLWLNKIVKIPTIKYQAKIDGGFVKVSWGSLAFIPDMFVDSAGALISPPSNMVVTATWGPDDDSGSSYLAFKGQGKLRAEHERGTTYDLYEEEIPVNALSEGVGLESTKECGTIVVVDADTLEVTTTQSQDYLVGDDVFLQEEDNGVTSPLHGRYEIIDWVGMDSTSFRISAPAHGISSWSSSTDPLEVSNEIVISPLCIGQVSHMTAQRTGHDFESKYLRPNLMGVMDTKGEVELAGATVAESAPSSGKIKVTLTGIAPHDVHHFLVGEQIVIHRAKHYAGTFVIDSVAGDNTWFIVASPYIPAGTDVLGGDAYAEYDYHNEVSSGVYLIELYDESVSISSSVATEWETDATGNAFWLRTSGGTITITKGTLSCKGLAHRPDNTALPMRSLKDLFDWACVEMGLTLVEHGTPESIPIDHVQYEQIKIIDLLDNVAGYANYSFYVAGTELILIDNNTAKGTVGTLDDYSIVDAKFDHQFAVKGVRGEWSAREKATAVTDTGTDGAPYLREFTKSVLRDTGEANGEVQTLAVYNETKTRVLQRLQPLLAERQKASVKITIPLTRLNTIGEEFTYEELYTVPQRSITARVREIEYDFDNEKISFVGYGSLADL